APPLQQGIDEAKKQGATILWCHNTFGLEDIPNWIGGRPHAQNIFDGDPEAHHGYQETFYRYLNAGLRVPFSTGTDWFIYDFSRAYAAVQTLSAPRDWLRALEAGRTFITNGPFLDLEVDGKGPGETVSLEAARSVRLKASALGRVNFRRLELIRNGEVLEGIDTRVRDGHFAASIEKSLSVEGPCWFALRIPPPPTKEAPQADVPRSELGGPLFAHTSALHVEVGGRKHFDAGAAKSLLDEMGQAREKILKNGVFASDHERDHVLSVYALAISALEKRLAK
ncbi:MAG: CehA/McbA family metallohydrolase, partial [Planctomycetes bacterium]|nr:CehA/McbA family metallohydrolase [Planctomycetota bacterium]